MFLVGVLAVSGSIQYCIIEYFETNIYDISV